MVEARATLLQGLTTRLIMNVASKGRIHYTLIVANQYAVLKLTD